MQLQHPKRRMIGAIGAMAMAMAMAMVLVTPALSGPNRADGGNSDQRAFGHVGTFDVRDNATEVAEIVVATRDGRTLLYTDSETEQIGFVDISDPSSPQADGTVEMMGEPTSVDTANRYALAAVNTSPSFVNPDGELVVIDVHKREVVATMNLGGQPDAVKVSPDGRFAAVVLENERDEDTNDGLIPQLPSGSLAVVELKGNPGQWSIESVDLAGLADVAPSDAEPEYVDINKRNQAVVSLQENNHAVVVDLETASVVTDFNLGVVTLEGVDATEEELGPQDNGLIILEETITRRREPDTVAWVDDDSFATANEGDYEDASGETGGSRGWTIFNIDGTVEHDAGTSFEYAGIRAGHYNEGRSGNKGSEPESLAIGQYGGRSLMFVGAERANYVEVLDVTTGTPEHLELLPTGIGPEGLEPIENRRLLAIANETAEGTVPSMITLYAQERGPAPYPTLTSVDHGGTPIPWVAQSGLAGDLDDPDRLWSVSDSILAAGYVHEIAVDGDRGMIVDRHEVTGASFNLDLEGIADAPEGGFWLASEGRSGARPNALVKTDDTFAVTDEVELPVALSTGATNSGFEGVALEPTADGSGTKYVYGVIQREWADDASGEIKIARYDVAADEWAFVVYQKAAPESPLGGWVGMSEITRLPDGTFALVERDNQLGTDARIKKIYGVDLAGADFRPYGGSLATVDKTLLADVIDELEANSVWTPDKLEGLGVTADGEVYLVTDNDGLDEAIGQTVFLHLGDVVPWRVREGPPAPAPR